MFPGRAVSQRAFESERHDNTGGAVLRQEEGGQGVKNRRGAESKMS